MSELIVIGFDSPAKARVAYNETLTLQAESTSICRDGWQS